MGVDIPVRLKLFSEPATCAAVEGDHSGGLVVEVFDDSDKVGTDILLPYGYLQRSMLNPVKGFLEVYEDMVKVLLVLEIFLTKDSEVEDLLCGALSSSQDSSLPVLQQRSSPLAASVCSV